MTSYGHQVPEGFVLSTELFGAMPAMLDLLLYDDTIRRVREAVGRWSGRSACASAIRASCCCSPSAPARRSPCRA